MRKLISYLFISVDGVVEAPNRFLRSDLYQDLDPLDETLGEQDAVILGRKTYEEWSAYWPRSEIEPFASFINAVPKHVVSRTLRDFTWSNSALLAGDFQGAVAALKRRPGKAIGVHGSISLVESLLVAGLVDELKLVVCPAAAGSGRRLLSRDGEAIQLDLKSALTTPGGLHFLSYAPRV
jgi:dihydrofolate reductase